MRMANRPQHPDKDIEKAVKYAEKRGWVYHPSGNSAHAWGRLLCPLKKREGCSMSVWCTPRNPQNHAKQIKKRIDECIHSGASDA